MTKDYAALCQRVVFFSPMEGRSSTSTQTWRDFRGLSDRRVNKEELFLIWCCFCHSVLQI